MQPQNPSAPPGPISLRHVALVVSDVRRSESFYVDVLGMRMEWKPDEDNCYLTNGSDNLALHKGTGDWSGVQRLDHIGFIVRTPEEVDAWAAYLKSRQVRLRAEPRTHRDGARSLYLEDPDGVVIQIIYHPPISR